MRDIKIFINGKEINAKENQTILNAALDAGIYIPHLCAHPDLPPAGHCRMCVVEIDGIEGVVPSCETMCKEGMHITTQSKKINKLRNVALELMLAGHPHDCTSCKVYLKCELQALMQYQGVVHARMRAIERETAAIICKDPLIIREPERCISCGRCIRACRDLRNVGVLDYHRMGDEVYVGTKDHLPLSGTDCRFCGACVEVCPTGALQDVEGVFQTDIPKAQALVPCQASCPAHTDIPRYISLAHEGKYAEAVAVIREKLPFPHTLGYICNHVCEDGCKRGKLDQPLAIRAIKRLAVEQDKDRPWLNKVLSPLAPNSGKTVAVIGSGPAGMTAAYYLARKGHKVTVFERLSKPGGMMTACIPEFRLPENIVLNEIDILKQVGIELKLNQEIAHVRTLKMEYDAVLAATGAWQGRKLMSIAGSDTKNSFSALEFLQAAKTGEQINIGDKVIVIGGGNVAFDCARTLVRINKKVNVVCLEKGNTMPADEEDIVLSKAEGVKILDGKASIAIETKNGFATGLKVMDVEKFYFDDAKKAVIETKKGTEETIPCDSVIFAAGQANHLTSGFGLKFNEYGYPIYNKDTMQTSIEGVFAAGDAITGTRFVIDAIASGRQAAENMDLYLGGDGKIDEMLTEHKTLDRKIGTIPNFSNLQRVVCDNESFDCECGNNESKRCLKCDLRRDISSVKLWTSYTEDKR